MNTYNALLYPGLPFVQTHPNRLATLATLHGMQPAEVSTARILEIGCGDATNLIAVAARLPHSECVGIDLAEAGIQQGRAAAGELGLSNVRLECLDLMDVGSSFGEFDYVIAHGLYSWVPDFVRDKLLSVCSQNLAPQGVAFISYNTYPGAHLRNMVRDMMRYHVRQCAAAKGAAAKGAVAKDAAGQGAAGEAIDIPEQLSQARAFVQYLSEHAKTNDDVYPQVIRKEAARIADYRDSSLFHDDLSDCNAPVHFHEFVAHAAGHDLQFLSEAHFFETEAASRLRGEVAKWPQAAEDVISREQYLDFQQGRRFRQTLLCHARCQLNRSLDPQRVWALSIGSPISSGAVEVGRDVRPAMTFVGPKNQRLKTDDPFLQSALLVLGDTWPQTLAFPELAALAQTHMANRGTQSDTRTPAEQQTYLASALLQAYAANLVELHRHPPQFTGQVTDRPQASPLARWQAQRQAMVTNLRHYNITIEDDLCGVLLSLLDGTRDRAALVDAICQSDGFAVTRGGEPVGDMSEVRAALSDRIEQILGEFAQQTLLVS